MEIEDRNKPPTYQQPNPYLFMGVEIEQEWKDKFHNLEDYLHLGAQETIQFVLRDWFKNSKIGDKS